MLNLSGLTTTFTSRSSARRRGRRAGVEVVGALNAASQMALFYPPGLDELMRRELGCDSGRHGNGRGSAH